MFWNSGLKKKKNVDKKPKDRMIFLRINYNNIYLFFVNTHLKPTKEKRKLIIEEHKNSKFGSVSVSHIWLSSICVIIIWRV